MVLSPDVLDKVIADVCLILPRLIATTVRLVEPEKGAFTLLMELGDAKSDEKPCVKELDRQPTLNTMDRVAL